jgi:5-formyltetrahydrofolate cyclo-ligase
MTDRIILKAGLRQKIRGQIGALTAGQRADASTRARALLAAQHIWNQAQSILFYSPMADELDVWPLLVEALQHGKTVLLPRFIPDTRVYGAFQVSDPKRDCAPGKFGICEPSAACPAFPLNRLDFVLAPGVGFDTAGHRLGRGGGYYDRLLAHVSGVKCGVAFDEQVVHQIPAEPHDIQMDFVLTPTQWIKTPALKFRS